VSWSAAFLVLVGSEAGELGCLRWGLLAELLEVALAVPGLVDLLEAALVVPVDLLEAAVVVPVDLLEAVPHFQPQGILRPRPLAQFPTVDSSTHHRKPVLPLDT